MSEKRERMGAFRLKIGATSVKVDLFDALQWDDGEPGCVRVWLNGRWHNGPNGERLWLDADKVAGLIRDLLLTNGELPPPCCHPARPVVKKAQMVSLPCGPYAADGEALGREQGRIASEDVLLGHDGRWYVLAGGVVCRLGFVAYEDLRFVPQKR